MFRELIPALSDRFHIVAPDLPEFGQSDMPPHDEFSYTFAKLAEVIEHFTEGLGLVRFAIYVFDYGAPTGFRLAVRHPERIIAIISQNGNAYKSRAERRLESHPDLLAGRISGQPRRTSYLPHPRLTPETIFWQYTHGVSAATHVSPDGYSLDNFYLAGPGAHEVQLDLLGDYKNNVALYPTFQAYFRTHQPPFMAVWGDPFFLPSGAKAFKRDIPNADIRFFRTDHFALETHCGEIAAAIREFIGRLKSA
jgi:pimeloyl-ACP methyl ester carboxylesterase